MTTSRITFRVDGTPATAGSKRGFPVHGKDGRVHVSLVDDSGEKGKSWRTLIADAARAAHAGAPIDGPVFLWIEFRSIRPKSHYLISKRSGTRLREDAPEYPTGKPDATKLLRAVEDALKGITWTDDCRVVDQRVRKVYGERPGADVLIEELSRARGGIALDLFDGIPAPTEPPPSLAAPARPATASRGAATSGRGKAPAPPGGIPGEISHCSECAAAVLPGEPRCLHCGAR